VYSNLITNNLLDVVLAKQLRFIIENELKGIFHLGSVDMMTHAQFYEHILDKLVSDNSLLRYRLYENKADTCYRMRRKTPRFSHGDIRRSSLGERL
jgi:dTDP-4-dehydrorhamnose reductase